MSNWLKYSPTSGHGNGTITITADTLSELEDRVATIVASNSQYGISDSVSIKQLKGSPPLSTPLTFKITSGGTIFWKSSKDNGYKKTISYSKNDGDWVEITSSEEGTPINVSTGDFIKFKGDNSSYYSAGYNTHYSKFLDNCRFEVYGNIMSLINGDNFADKTEFTSKYALRYIFGNCTGLTDVSYLLLPATTLSEGCYWSMFEGCTSLTTAPELPATTLAGGCYYQMFQGCTSLTTVPSNLLPATTLAENCYSGMFRGCTSLTTVPSNLLPATNLASSCYSSMFGRCTSLTTAPELPATTLAGGCYAGMFRDCKSLTTVPSNLLPATTLAENCYGGMFNGCGLRTVPSNLLPATTLADYCYSSMFEGCKSLTDASGLLLPATNLSPYCYRFMFRGCKSLTKAPELPATTLAEACYYYMFRGCTSLTKAPSILPATTLAKYCYYCMFWECTSLTTSPILPATTVEGDCYESMFASCKNLNYVKCLSDGMFGKNWLEGVALTGTFVKSPDLIAWTTGPSGIPKGWTVINAS